MLTKFSGISVKGSGSTKMRSIFPSTRQIKREEKREKEREERKLAKLLGGTGK